MTDWTQKCPPFDSQYCAATHSDVLDCTVESLAHIFFMLTGIRVSPRAWAVVCNLDNPLNRNVQHVLNVVNAFGYVLWDDCPTPDIFTMDSYYQPLTEAEAKFHPCHIDLIPPDLDKSPLWTEISLGFDSPGVIASKHMVAGINPTQYFDSEQGNPIKDYGTNPIIWQSSLTITNMAQFKTQNYKGELRIILQADSPDTWEALCKVYGIDPNAPIDEVI